mgnify:CR=1 FL=1
MRESCSAHITSTRASAVSTAQRVEVWRTLSKTQVATGLTAQATGDLLNKRLRLLWPDLITDDAGREVEGYFLCAAYAGMVGGIAPHQGLRNVQIKGFATTPRSIRRCLTRPGPLKVPPGFADCRR